MTQSGYEIQAATQFSSNSQFGGNDGTLPFSCHIKHLFPGETTLFPPSFVSHNKFKIAVF